MNLRDTRTRYLLRMALSLALPLIESEDRKDMQDLLDKLNGDSWSRTHESVCWQMEAQALVRDALQAGASWHEALEGCPNPASTSPKVVPFRPATTDEAS
jgi:hypothetical protein